jgi:hypothetical protein
MAGTAPSFGFSFRCSTCPSGSVCLFPHINQAWDIELLFLSFTNLSATGMGDILPISAPARVIAMLEQFSGVGYVTIVVSRLVGLTTNFMNRKNNPV